METVVHFVRDLSIPARSAAEQLVGHGLSEDQRLVIQVIDMSRAAGDTEVTTDDERLPDWCNVYAGLSDEEIEGLEKAISRRLDLTR